MPTSVVNRTLIDCEISFSRRSAPSHQPERLAAALILEDLVRQRQGMPDAVRVDLRAEPLRDDVDEVVLEVLRDTRDERHADGGQQQDADASKELARGVFLVARRVLIDDVSKDQRVEQREDLVDGGEYKGQRHE